MTNVSSFELAVLAPNKGKPGTLIATRTVYADTVSAAVAKVRQEVEGTGFIVVQAASLKKEPDVSASVKAICDKLGIKEAVTNAIEEVGVEGFKKTSLFMSNKIDVA